MKKLIYCVILSLLVSGCTIKKEPKVVEPCSKYPKICFGKQGKAPTKVEACNALLACSDWILRAKD